jgi:hypothetical protein
LENPGTPAVHGGRFAAGFTLFYSRNGMCNMPKIFLENIQTGGIKALPKITTTHYFEIML